MVTSYIGLGTNLGDRRKNIREALDLLGSLNNVKISNESSLYETQPQDCPADTPGFLNAVVEIKTSLTAIKLLKELQEIEKKLGRKRSKIRHSSRNIDLDILFYGCKKINLPNLKVPHPKITQRRFVLSPLNEVAPRMIKRLSRDIKIFRTIRGARLWIKTKKQSAKTIGLVPTMGFLHQGHLSLIRKAKKDCDVCIASIFVNPLQFSPGEDYKQYPREPALDSILSYSGGCDAVFYPAPEEMYPQDYQTYINAEKMNDSLCAKSRPGHFKGVLTVVAKLFNIIQPDMAYFGQKDYQQAVLADKMAKDLNFPLKIKIMPIIRDPDGLAMSSRNSYLNKEQRQDARVIHQSMVMAEEIIKKGEKDIMRIKSAVRGLILSKKTVRIDYIEIVCPDTLEALRELKGRALLAIAARIGKTRLIDNVLINENN